MSKSSASPSANSSLWKHRALIQQFTLRNVELRHRGSHLGLVWSFLNPLLLLGLYVFVFGYIFGGSFGIPGESRVDYSLGIFLGLSMFHFLAETIGLAPTLIVGNPNFVKKVVFPLEVLPIAAVGASLIHLLISLGLVLIGVTFFGRGISAGVLWLPIILLPLVLFSLGISWLLSALGTFFRDFSQVTQFLTMALMFSSAIFSPASKIPEAAWQILRWNPMLLAVELSRDAVLWDRELNLRHLGYLYLSGAFLAWCGYAGFRRMKPAFADVL